MSNTYNPCREIGDCVCKYSKLWDIVNIRDGKYELKFRASDDNSKSDNIWVDCKKVDTSREHFDHGGEGITIATVYIQEDGDIIIE